MPSSTTVACSAAASHAQSSARANLFSSAQRSGGGSAGRPLAQRTIVIVGDDACARERLVAKAKSLGAQVAELRVLAGSGYRPPEPQPVPSHCSAAIFADESALRASFECLAVLAAGLVPLRATFLDSVQPLSIVSASKHALPSFMAEQAWQSHHLTSVAHAPERELASALLAVGARRSASAQRDRLWEGWRVHVHPSAYTDEAESPGDDAGSGAAWAAAGSCRFDEGELCALLLSGGATIVEGAAAATDADLVLTGRHGADDDALPRSAPCVPLSVLMRCARGELECSSTDALIREAERLLPPPRGHPEAMLPAAATRGIGGGFGGGGSAGVGGGGGAHEPSKRRTRHSGTGAERPMTSGGAGPAAANKRQRAL